MNHSVKYSTDALTERKNQFKNICQASLLYIKIEALPLFSTVYYYYYFCYALIEKQKYIYMEKSTLRDYSV